MNSSSPSKKNPFLSPQPTGASTVSTHLTGNPFLSPQESGPPPPLPSTKPVVFPVPSFDTGAGPSSQSYAASSSSAYNASPGTQLADPFARMSFLDTTRPRDEKGKAPVSVESSPDTPTAEVLPLVPVHHTGALQSSIASGPASPLPVLPPRKPGLPISPRPISSSRQDLNGRQADSSSRPETFAPPPGPPPTLATSSYSSSPPSSVAVASTSSQSIAPPSGPPPSASIRSPQRQDSVSVLDLPDEAPPAYSLSADASQGESALQYGPRRPFQPAPPPVNQVQNYPAPQGQPVGPYPGGFSPPPHPPPPNMSMPRPYAPPPQHPNSSFSPPPHPPPATSFSPPPHPPPASGFSPPPHPPPSASFSPPSHPPPSSTSEPHSDFARDFYTAGAGGASAGPSSPPSGGGNHYTPPPGPPPPTHPSSPNKPSSTSSGGGSRRSDAVPDDGRPTTTPTPGHPLLNNGRILVYTGNHVCRKCNNTGYKHADPSHPCRRCWETYGRQYSGAVAYAPSSSGTGTGSSRPSTAGLTFQKPLPNLRPPHQNPVASQPHPQTPQQMPGGYTGPQHSAYAPQRPPYQRGPSSQPQISYTAPGRGPPPGAAVVMPGDPRIGGRLCWRCDGRGITTFLIFDESTCEVCGGIGRVFN